MLEQRCGLGFAGRDVYLNVAGGLRITEPAADLAVAAALISALFDEPLPDACVAFGEVALSGDVRRVSRAEARLKEAAKLGFTAALAPQGVEEAGGVSVTGLARIADLAQTFSSAAGYGDNEDEAGARSVGGPGGQQKAGRAGGGQQGRQDTARQDR